MIELALFVSTFAVVFALGFQSLNVNGGHYWCAFFTSFAISGSNLVLFKLAPNANLAECIAYMGGGPFGIVASMWAHRRWIGTKRQLEELGPMSEDSWAPRVRLFLEGRDRTTVRTILSECLDIPDHEITTAAGARVTAILGRQGWSRFREPGGDGRWLWAAPPLEVRL